MIELSKIAQTLAFTLFGSACVNHRSYAIDAEAIDLYSQQVTIEFRDAGSAKQAVVTIAPLWNDHRRAVSCRWDDNWTSDNETTRDLMEEYGIRGTWYLNDREFSPENKPADYLPVAKKLLEGGNSVGGHSLTHPFLTYFHNNRMFAEMSGVRVAWEAALDKPVVSYAYSFIDLRPEPEGKAVLQRTLKTLERAGYHHVAEYINFFEDLDMKQELSPIMPPENNSFDVFEEAVDWAYQDERLTESFPMITNSMHAWYGTSRLPYGYDELRKRFELLSKLEDVWHCNQNQYAAYRRQFRLAKSTQVERSGNTLRLRLTRPSVLAVNDATPLTLSISGVSPDAIERVACDDASVDISERQLPERTLVHVRHSSNQTLPRKISHLANPGNDRGKDNLPTDPEFPALHGAICVDDGQIWLRLDCDDPKSLNDVRVAWRVPIGWRVDTVVQKPKQSRDGILKISQPLTPVGGPDNRWGQTHFAAQVDFRFKGQSGRIHFTCQTPGDEPDDSLPLDGFAILGPIPNEQWDTERFLKTIQHDGDCEQWRMSDGSDLAWRIDSQDGYINHQWLNPEYVRTMGTWDHHAPTYVVRSEIISPFARKARLQTSHESLRTIVFNGQVVDSEIVDLKEGKNQLVIIYPGCNLGVQTQRLAACFVRLSDPEIGQRIENLRYQPY